jgi:hypothetical protein
MTADQHRRKIMNDSYEPTQEDLAQLVRNCERMQTYDMSPEDLLRMAKGMHDPKNARAEEDWRRYFTERNYVLMPTGEFVPLEILDAVLTFEPKPSRLARAMTWLLGIFK